MISRCCSQPRLRASAVMLLALGLLGLAVLHTPALALAGACPNESSPGFRSYLPECRAYELVSPAYKEGFKADVEAVSESGDKVIAQSFGNFSGTRNTGPFGQSYELARGPSGWSSTPLDAPFSEFSLSNLEAISPDFTRALWLGFTPANPVSEGKYSGPPHGPRTLVGPGTPPGVGEASALALVGASEDLSHVLYTGHSHEAREISHLWPCDTTADGRLPSLYEYAGAENDEPRLVGVSNDGTPANNCAAHLISDCGTVLGGFPAEDGYNAVSADGRRVFFTAAGESSCEQGSAPAPPVNELYARIDGSHTTPISEPEEADCKKCEIGPGSRSNAQFAGASQDGSQVFFTTEQHLLAAATGTGPFLYQYDFNAPAGDRVALLSGGDPAGSAVEGVARVSEDGSHIYFVARGVLIGANAEGATPLAAAPNLYVSIRECPGHARACEEPATRLVFIATLSEADAADWNPEDLRRVQATPDGRFLLFTSAADLTPDEHGQSEAGQIFEYDAQNETLKRVSVGQAGYNSDGNSGEYAATVLAQGYTQDRPVARSTFLALSADGSRVFFSSDDALTPQAMAGLKNIYEYHDGTVDLISDGHDEVSASNRGTLELIGTDASGLDVFFTTADPLVPQDTDTQADIYDARIDGGPTPAVPPAPCAGDACQGAASALPPPAATAPATGEAPIPPTPNGPGPKPSKSLTRAQKLARTLRACIHRPKRQRASCQAHARKLYGPKLKAASHTGGK